MSEAETAPDSAQELAIKRTQWASERTRLANERTLIAWLRTGLAVVGFGALVPRVLSNVQAEWLVWLVSVLFVVTGSIVLFFGVRNYREMTTRLGEKQVGVSWWLVALLTGALELGAILILILFLLG